MRALIALTLVLLLQTPVAPPAPPTLTSVQRLQFQNLSLRIENAQLKAAQAQREFDAARADIQKLVAAVKVEGYTLDLATLTYQKEKK